jgi:hypothetical protein
MHEPVDDRCPTRAISRAWDMPDERDVNKSDETTLGVAGILSVSPLDSDTSRIRLGPAAGWMAPKGISTWEREISFVRRSNMTASFASALRATVPGDQVAPKRFPTVRKVVDVSPLLGLAGNLVQDARAQGVRVHTVGVDRVSGDFFYFEEGGAHQPVRSQGNLVEMLAPSLDAASTNADIAALMDGLLDRLLLVLSGGAVSELAVELVDALPRLARDGTGLVGTDLEAFEAHSSALASRSARWVAALRRIPEALDTAARRGQKTASVPLYGEARQATRPALNTIVGGKALLLPPQVWWTVTGSPREEIKGGPVATTTPATPAAEAKRSTPTAERKPVAVRKDAKLSPTAPEVAPAPAPASAQGAAPAPAPAAVAAPAPASAPAPLVAPIAPDSEPAPEAHAAAAITAAVANESGPSPVVLVPREEEPAPIVAVAGAPRAAATTASSALRPVPKRSPVARIVALLLLAAVAYFALWRMR